jgi:hypothetical protein
MEGAANWVDLYIPDIGSSAPEFDGSDLTFEYTIDGTNWNTVPGMLVADDEVGYKGRFLVLGSKLRYTSANNVGSAATVAPIVTYKNASMTQVKSDFSSFVQGVLSGDTGNESFTFGRAPAVLFLDVEGSTFDSVSMVIQASVDGTNWFDLPGARVTAAGQYAWFNNPGGLTRFRIEWTGGGLSMVAGRATVIGLTNLDGGGIKKNADVLVDAADLLVTSGDGTAAADATLVDVTATWDATALGIYNDNNITIIEEVNKLKVLTDRMVEVMQVNGDLPSGNGLEA